MSTIKTKKVQVGTDSTASNNFTIYTPGTPDGTVRIGNGNADSPTEIARFDANGLIMASGKSVSGNPPQVTVYTSGTGTYTTPTGATYLTVEMVGGGAGGMASSSAGAPATGGAGGSTTFGTSLLTCNGAGVSSYGGVNAGGTATVSSPAVGIAITGSAGATASLGYNGSVPYASGGMGGCGPFGGAGQNQWSTNNAGNGATNSGSGGGGAGSDTGTIAIPGGGGGSGGYIKAFITSPSASYSYAVGAGGTGGAAGPNGANGGNGGSGIIIVTAYFG